MQLSPAEYVIRVFGGVRKTAKILGLYPSTVSKWQCYEGKNGKIGLIPSSQHQQIIDIARAMKLPITPEDLIYGRKLDDTAREQEIFVD